MPAALAGMFGGGGAAAAGSSTAGATATGASASGSIADVSGAEAGAGAVGPTAAEGSGATSDISSMGASAGGGKGLGLIKGPGAITAVALGATISSASAVLSGIDANKIASRISGQYTQQAQQIALATSNQINAQDTEANQLLAKNRTTMASSGVTQGGSGKVVNQASATEENLKDAMTRYSGELARNSALYSAANARWQGKVQEYSSFVNAGTSMLTAGLMLG